MKANEIREKSDTELVELETELRTQLINLRIAQATSKPVVFAKIRESRRDIARIKTIQTQRANGAGGQS